LPDFDLPLGELELGAPDAAVAAVEAEDADLAFLKGTDETETKLELARAYVDMGDLQGARDILEEVAEEGSGEQREQAAALLERIGTS
jgi:pilus assembly protein FimV